MDGQSPYQDGVVGIEGWETLLINNHPSIFYKNVIHITTRGCFIKKIKNEAECLHHAFITTLFN
jgi:hypothetical protein